DIGAAIAALQRQAGTRRHLLFGICSGGDDGLAAAIEHPSIAAIVALDPVIYPSLRWRVSLYASKLRRNGIAGTFARLREIGPLQRHYAMLGNHGRKPPPLPAYVERLRSLAERGVAVTLVYTGSTVDRREFEEQQRKVLARHGLEERIGAEFLPDVDHLVTSLAAQQQVLERLPEWLHAVPDR
ncbi:MAG TPA: hypothetical protein VM491_06940, partial [Burkholderiaceae bacterium]|nr:hypothetical protein [Burkholderiaceae bacterium]